MRVKRWVALGVAVLIVCYGVWEFARVPLRLSLPSRLWLAQLDVYEHGYGEFVRCARFPLQAQEG